MSVLQERRKILKSFLFIVALLAMRFLACQAQSNSPLPGQLFFKRISTEQGLPQPTVNAILRDSRGFVWFATEDGLSRYDGNEFKVFRHDSHDSTSLSHDVVHFIEEEKGSGNLWVGTLTGISYFNRYTERFTVFKGENHPGTIYANAAIDKKRNCLWLACTVGGLRYFDFSAKKIISYTSHNLDKIQVWSVKVSGDSLFIGTLQYGLKIIDLKSGKLTTVDSTASIRSLLVDQQHVWYGTEGNGLGRIDRNTGDITRYTEGNGSLNNDDVWALAKDKDDNIWIGTDGGGLNILPRQQRKAIAYEHSEFDERSLGANTIRSIFLEQDGAAWLGTYNGGVSYHPISPIQFQWYKKEFSNDNSLSNNVVNAFAEAPDGTIWIGTDGGGLNYLKEGIVRRYKMPAALQHISVIVSLFCDETGLWIGTFHGGLIHLDLHGGWKQYLQQADNRASISHNTVWDIKKDSLGYLWLGTDRGVNRFDPVNKVFHNLDNPLPGKIRRIFRNLQAQSVLITSTNTLWVGSYGLLASYMPASDSVMEMASVKTNEHVIPDLRVKDLLEDNGMIWIGTYGSGLCGYDPVHNSFVVLEEHDGLPNNVVLSMEKGLPGSLWLSTNKGLVYYSIADTVFTAFDENDGVQGTVFNRNASLLTRDGRLLFGGTRGFTVFSPGKVRRNLNSLSIVFTRLQVFNEAVKPASSLLKNSIAETKALDFSYRDSRLITLSFSALNFSSPEKIVYVYKLEGFNTAWQPIGKEHIITFTNLDPAKYRLCVRASFDGRLWGPEKALSITIRTPWWMTWYFRGVFFILLCTMAYSFIRYRTYRLKKQKEELEHLVNEQSREIKQQNDDLAAQNEELTLQNEQVLAQAETISAQNIMLQDAQQKLQRINESLEQAVHHRTEKLNETITQLNKTIKELDAFVYSASHDLIAPLKSVLGLVNLARRQNIDADVQIYLNHIELSIEKLEDVIKNMIQYSRNSRLEVVSDEVNLRELINECLADVKFLPGADTIVVETELGDDPVLYSDRQRLKIILSNLLTNAVKYRDTMKEKSIIRISFEKGKTEWRLEVYDNGIGIHKKYLSRVFEMFYRATNRAQGSGLGLYIVKETVERLYGEIYVDSESGEWTKFVVTIPYKNVYFRKK